MRFPGGGGGEMDGGVSLPGSEWVSSLLGFRSWWWLLGVSFFL